MSSFSETVEQQLRECFPNINLPRREKHQADSRVGKSRVSSVESTSDPRAASAGFGSRALTGLITDNPVIENSLDYKSKGTLIGYEYFIALADGKSITPKLYRKQVFTKVTLSDRRFKLESFLSALLFQSMALAPVVDLNINSYSGNPDYFHGCYELKFSRPDQKLSLPSLQSNEKLISWKITVLKSVSATPRHLLLYEKVENFYYLQSSVAVGTSVT